MFANELKKFLREKDLTIINFCKIIEYNPSYLSRVMYGKPNHTPGRKLAEAIYYATLGAIDLRVKPKKIRKKDQKDSNPS